MTFASAEKVNGSFNGFK